MWKLFSSETEDKGNTKSTITRQVKEFRKVWNGKPYHNFGVERVVMLILVLLPFGDLGLYYRNLFIGKKQLLHRKIYIDFYVVLNLILPILVLFCGWYMYSWVVVVCIYFGVMTMAALLSMSFLHHNIPSAISYRRNIISLFLNFLQFVSLFAVLYMYVGGECFKIDQCTNEQMSSLQALYLSLETFTSVGFGDIHPCKDSGYIILIIQMAVQILFAYLFFASFVDRINDPTFFNYKKEKK